MIQQILLARFSRGPIEPLVLGVAWTELRQIRGGYIAVIGAPRNILL